MRKKGITIGRMARDLQVIVQKTIYNVVEVLS